MAVTAMSATVTLEEPLVGKKRFALSYGEEWSVPHRMFSLEEVVSYLHLSKSDVDRLVREKEIPYEQRGGRIVFQKKEVDAWASQRILGLTANRLTDYHKASSAKFHDLSKQHAIMPELIHADFIETTLISKTKASLMRDMVDFAEKTGLVVYPKDLLESLRERERLGTTALAGGIALLHPKNHEPYLFEDSFIVMGRSVQPIPFGAPDGATTDLFFLVCCQDDRIHLHVLARLCMMCLYTSLVLDLREAGDAATMYDGIVKSEQEVIQQL